MYLGLRKDPYHLVEDSFVLSMFGKNSKTARRNYMKLVFKCDDESGVEDVEFKNEPIEYRSQRNILVRNADPEKIVEFIASKLNVSHIKVHMKNYRKMVEAKALVVVIMRSLCNAKCSEICRVLGGICQCRVSSLASLGMELLDKEEYCNIISEFMNSNAA